MRVQGTVANYIRLVLFAVATGNTLRKRLTIAQASRFALRTINKDYVHSLRVATFE